ncbi:MAG TPA: CdaR family protein [Bryobacteraceae bacterium]|jgi:YbbR domain-containing protein|nr:CdaR family protein [Bryobacteraceae bacterium]
MKFLTANLGWKLLALLIAVALWIAVAREPELATSIAAPVEYKNIPDDLDIGSNLPDRVRLEVRGPSGRLSRDNLTDVAVILDLKDAGPGERTYNIRPANINLPAGVSFYRALPSQVTLRFDKLLTKEVEIVPAPYSKGPPDGYRVRSYTLKPAKTLIRGPEQRIRNISHVTLDPVDLSGVISEAEFHTHVNVGDSQVRLEVPSTIELRITLEKSPQKETK